MAAANVSIQYYRINDNETYCLLLCVMQYSVFNLIIKYMKMVLWLFPAIMTDILRNQ